MGKSVMIEAQVGPVFWILSTVILISALLVVSIKNIFHSALFLVLCLFSVAGIYILLNAEFLAAAQVLIYVGAISILMIFAVMLTSNLASATIVHVNRNTVVGFFACLVFFIGIWALIGRTRIWQYAREELPVENVLIIGKLLMTHFMLPFEVVSVLMLAAMIGAIVLAREESS
jgi:NADH:ubiquinone oxidoreductase subunit 6 (subunit J)